MKTVSFENRYVTFVNGYRTIVIAMTVPSSQQDLTGILGHSSNLSTSSQSSLSSLLMKNHPPLSLLNETLPYLKSSQSLAEDLNILGVSPVEDHHAEYDSKMKLSSVFDDDCDIGLIPFGQSDMKMLDPGNQCIKVYNYIHIVPYKLRASLCYYCAYRCLAI